jgi:hypothetical protein
VCAAVVVLLLVTEVIRQAEAPCFRRLSRQMISNALN